MKTGKVIQCPAAFTTVSTESLFGLTGKYLEAQRTLAEIDLDPQTIKDTLESLEGDVAVKALRVVAMAQTFDAFAGAIAERVKAMQARQKAAEAQAEHLRTYVLESLKAAGFEAGDKIVSPEMELRLQKNPPKVDIFDEKAIPSFYWRTPPQPADVIDKAAIKDYLTAGLAEGAIPRSVPGATLVAGVRLVEK